MSASKSGLRGERWHGLRVILFTVLIPLAASAAARSQASWMQARNQEAQIQPWMQHAMAYDAARGRTVLFGGRHIHSLDPTNVLWEFDGAVWQQRTPAVSPPARAAHAMAYDPIRRRCVVFGGYSGTASPYHGDTWEWDGTTWHQFAGAGPSARTESSMVFDPGRGRIVLFGGLQSPTFLADVWEYDGSSWNNIKPAGARPTGRAGHVMAYDSARSCIVLFGGRVGPHDFVNDTWERTGYRWTLRSPATSPSARGYCAFAYDPDRQRAVMFGNPLAPDHDVWEWDGSNWGLQPADPDLYVFMGGSMVYDAASRRMVLHSHRTWLYGTLVPASSTYHGRSCSYSNPPLLDSNAPFLGNADFRVEVQRAAPAALGVLALGFSGTPQPFGPCTLYVDAYTLLMLVTDASGLAHASIRVPNSAYLRGVQMFAQAGVMDGEGPVYGLSLTAARALRIGD